jgi:cystathionine beta-synthase
LKDRLKPTDVVVCILHDHGSRYVAKIYNDQWMRDRGFLEVKTVRDVVNSRGPKKLLTLSPTDPISKAIELMRKYDIEHVPILDQGQPIGSVSESGLFQKLIDSPTLPHSIIGDHLEPNFPQVSLDTPLEKLSRTINKEVGAVLTKDEAGQYHIVTKYDIIQSLGN